MLGAYCGRSGVAMKACCLFADFRFALPGELLFFACAKKSSQKKAHPAAAPAARVPCAAHVLGVALT
ncbi:MAG: hypothetical protein ACPHN2_17725, partial [Sinimarinibacterium flocculans]|uniref:hypothetical protein n=1 Tax=Sinimarinibacterium flocculans TaxID=985250 RepID=UPI003C5A2E76